MGGNGHHLTSATPDAGWLNSPRFSISPALSGGGEAFPAGVTVADWLYRWLTSCSWCLTGEYDTVIAAPVALQWRSSPTARVEANQPLSHDSDMVRSPGFAG